jgi:hypothetical protein
MGDRILGQGIEEEPSRDIDSSQEENRSINPKINPLDTRLTATANFN